MTRDFWGEWNFLIPLLRGSLEKLKTAFPYAYPLTFGRHLEKISDFLFSVYLINGQFLQKSTRYHFFREKYALYFLQNLFFVSLLFSSLLTMIAKNLGDDLLKAGTARESLHFDKIRLILLVEVSQNFFRL